MDADAYPYTLDTLDREDLGLDLGSDGGSQGSPPDHFGSASDGLISDEGRSSDEEAAGAGQRQPQPQPQPPTRDHMTDASVSFAEWVPPPFVPPPMSDSSMAFDGPAALSASRAQLRETERTGKVLGIFNHDNRVPSGPHAEDTGSYSGLNRLGPSRTKVPGAPPRPPPRRRTDWASRPPFPAARQVDGQVRTTSSFAGHSCMHAEPDLGYVAGLLVEMEEPVEDSWRLVFRVFGNNEDLVRPRSPPCFF